MMELVLGFEALEILSVCIQAALPMPLETVKTGFEVLCCQSI